MKNFKNNEREVREVKTQEEHFTEHGIFFITKILTIKDIADILEVLPDTVNDYDIEEGVLNYLDETHNPKILNLYYEYDEKDKTVSIEALLQNQ